VLTKAESRQRWRELRDLVNAWDPVGLIAAGAPEDEYECIVGPVLRLLERDAAHAAIVDYLVGECSDHFGVPIGEPGAREFVVRVAGWYQRQWRALS
jgi:hypothetical protein